MLPSAFILQFDNALLKHFGTRASVHRLLSHFCSPNVVAVKLSIYCVLFWAAFYIREGLTKQVSMTLRRKRWPGVSSRRSGPFRHSRLNLLIKKGTAMIQPVAKTVPPFFIRGCRFNTEIRCVGLCRRSLQDEDM